MTVEELILKLQKFDSDQEVRIYDRYEREDYILKSVNDDDNVIWITF